MVVGGNEEEIGVDGGQVFEIWHRRRRAEQGFFLGEDARLVLPYPDPERAARIHGGEGVALMAEKNFFDAAGSLPVDYFFNVPAHRGRSGRGVLLRWRSLRVLLQR